MRYKILSFLFGWLAALGVFVNRWLSDLHEKHLIATALEPGTPVKVLCGCHTDQIWYVEEYCVSGHDYNLVRCWPPPDRFGRNHDVDDMHIGIEKIVAQKR